MVLRYCWLWCRFVGLVGYCFWFSVLVALSGLVGFVGLWACLTFRIAVLWVCLGLICFFGLF